MKTYYSDKENNVCIKDENGFPVKLISCVDKEQCDEFCEECNKQVKAESEVKWQ